MNNPPEKAKGYDPGLERSRSQDRNRLSDSERQTVPRFFIKNKFARLVANIVISLIWIVTNLAIFFFGSWYITYKLCSWNIFSGTFNCTGTGETLFSLHLLFSALLIFLPPLWLTWYLWIRKRVPKNK